jgi:hypothetical protein
MTPPAASSATTDSPGAGSGNYVVQQGECIESIAFKHGRHWEELWNDAGNAELRKARRHPHALLPGDRVFLRPVDPASRQCAIDQRHRFRRKGVPSMLRLTFLFDDQPRAGVPYKLIIDGKEFSGTTDSQGTLKQALLPNAATATLTLGEGDEAEEYKLELRHLNPAEEISGAQQRLANLGYDPGPADGQLNEQTRGALASFQAANDLPETGELDAATTEKLLGVHDDQVRA